MLNTVNIGLLLSTIFFCFFLTGCVNVAVWERGNLAKASMEIDPNPLQAISKRIITVVAKPLRAINLHPVGAVAAAIS